MIKKRITTLMLSAVMVLNVFLTILPAEAKSSEFIISGNEVTTKAGKEVAIDINMTNNPGISAINLYFTFDDQCFVLKQVENSISEFTMTSDLTTVWDAAEDYKEDGKLATLTFEVSEHVATGKYEVNVHFLSASNENFEAVVAETKAATIIVKDEETDETPEQNNPQKPVTHNTIQDKGLVYKVTSREEGKQTVECVGGNVSGTVKIPATIINNGVKYKVMSISAEAFKGNGKIKKVVLGKNVSQIGKKTFYNCKKLKTIVVKTKKLEKIGKNAISGIYKKAIIKIPKAKYKKYTGFLKKKTGYKKTMTISKN